MEALREGAKGEAVAALKRRLNELGYDCGEGDEYDRRTAWAVRWFCRRNDLADSGEANAQVLARLDSAAAGPADGYWQYYSMKDPLWAQYPYDAANTPEIERMEDSACGPTSMAIAVSTLLHRAVLPPVLADWSNAHGYRDPNGIDGTDDAFFPACAETYGLTAELVPLTDRGGAARRRGGDLQRGARLPLHPLRPLQPHPPHRERPRDHQRSRAEERRAAGLHRG